LIFEKNQVSQIPIPDGEIPFDVFKKHMLVECEELFKKMNLPDTQFQSFLLMLYIVSDMLVTESIYPNPYKNEL